MRERESVRNQEKRKKIKTEVTGQLQEEGIKSKAGGTEERRVERNRRKRGQNKF